MTYKYAGAGADATGAVATSIIENVLGLPVQPSLIGDIHGVIEGAPTKKELKDIDNSPAYSVIPGVGHSRLTQRLQKEYTDAGANEYEARARTTGTILNRRLTPLILGIAGALAGGMYGTHIYNEQKKRGIPNHNDFDWNNGSPIHPPFRYAVIGGMAGTAAGSLINMICGVAGALSDKKSKKDTKDDMYSYHKLLIPGYGAYEYSNQIFGD